MYMWHNELVSGEQMICGVRVLSECECVCV